MREPQGRVTQSILPLTRYFLAAVSFGRLQHLHPAVHSQNNLCPSVWLMLLWSFFLSFSFSLLFFFLIEQDVDENTCSVLLFLMNNLYKIKWHHGPITAGKRENGHAKRAVIDHSCFLVCQESPNKVSDVGITWAIKISSICMFQGHPLTLFSLSFCLPGK